MRRLWIMLLAIGLSGCEPAGLATDDDLDDDDDTATDDDLDDDDDTATDDDLDDDDDTATDDDTEPPDPCDPFAGLFSGFVTVEVYYSGQPGTDYQLQASVRVVDCRITGELTGGLSIEEFFGIVDPQSGAVDGVIAGDFADAGDMVILWSPAAFFGDTFQGGFAAQGWSYYFAEGSWTLAR